MRLYLILFATFFQGTGLLGQVYFNETYDNQNFTNENVTNIEITQDGKYILPGTGIYSEGDLLGGFFIRELLEDGLENQITTSFTTVENNIYVNYSESFISTNDGGFMQATACDSAIIIKYDESLNVEWIFSSDTISGFLCAIELQAGGFLACGYTYATNKIELIWIDDSGNSSMAKQLDPFFWTEFYFVVRMIELSDGNILLGGFHVHGFDTNQMLLRCDAEGNLLWSNEWDRFEVDWTVWPLVDNSEYAVVAFSHVDWTDNPEIIGDDTIHGRIGTMLVDLETGDTSNVILYPEELYYYWITDFIQASDSGYVVLGWEGVEDAYVYQSFILKLNSNREQVWLRRYSHESLNENPEQFSQAWDIEITPDSGFVVAGEWNDIIDQGKQMPWVFKTDACGDLVWSNCGETTVTAIEKKSPALSLYPNPASDVLNIEFHTIHSGGMLRITDSKGQLLISELIKPYQSYLSLNVSAVSSGVYFISYHDSLGEVFYQKLICK